MCLGWSCCQAFRSRARQHGGQTPVQGEDTLPIRVARPQGLPHSPDGPVRPRSSARPRERTPELRRRRPVSEAPSPAAGIERGTSPIRVRVPYSPQPEHPRGLRSHFLCLGLRQQRRQHAQHPGDRPSTVEELLILGPLLLPLCRHPGRSPHLVF